MLNTDETSTESEAVSTEPRWTSPIPEADRLRFLEDRRRLDAEAVKRDVEAALRSQAMKALAAHRPAVYAAATWDTVEARLPAEKLAAFRDWHRGGGENVLVLAGNPGTGKTWAAWAAVDQLAGHGMRATVRTASQLFEDLISHDPEVRARAERDYRETPVLVLDDLGKGWIAQNARGDESFMRKGLFGVVDHRTSNRLLTLVTTNWQKPEMAAEVGDATASRLRAGLLWVRMTGDDLRSQVPARDY